MRRKKDKEKVCCVCFNEHDALTQLTNKALDHVTYYKKLSSCIPEIEWQESFQICLSCIDLLDTAYTLRIKCLKSDETRRKQLSYHEKTKKRKSSRTNSRNKVKEESIDISENDIVENNEPILIDAIKDEEGEENKDKIKSEEIKFENDERKVADDFVLTELPTEDSADMECLDDRGNDVGNNDSHDESDDENKSLSELIKARKVKNTSSSCSTDRTAKESGLLKATRKMKKFPRQRRSRKEPAPKKDPPRKRERKTPLQLACDQCSFTSPLRPILVEHCALLHGMKSVDVKPYHCNLCQGKFTTYVNLYQHKKIHENNRSQVCSFCGKGFNAKSDLVTHEKRHMNKKEHACEECGKSFNTYKDLGSHKYVVHTDPSVWKHVCEICNKRFPIKSNYILHVKRHAGEKDFECHLCQKKFTEKSEVQRHMKSHSNERNYICSVCNKEYRDERNMKRHMAKAHLIGLGEIKIPVRVRKHQCHICTKAFYDKNKLVRHLYVHTGEKPFACSICSKAFNDRSYLKQHIQKSHGVEEDPGLSVVPPRMNLNALQYPSLGLSFGSSTSRLN